MGFAIKLGCGFPVVGLTVQLMDQIGDNYGPLIVVGAQVIRENKQRDCCKP